MKPEIIEVSGIWLRGCGHERVEVLAEIDGEWRVVIPSEHAEAGHGATVSHCVHPSGMRKAPKSDL